jgi:hypothetical protein
VGGLGLLGRGVCFEWERDEFGGVLGGIAVVLELRKVRMMSL